MTPLELCVNEMLFSISKLPDEICRWLSPGTPVSSTNKTDRHDINEILLKVALNTTNQTKPYNTYRLESESVLSR
jgi:hypothetical protein